MFFLYISNTVNPVIYAGMNSSFRNEFRRIITCRSRRVVISLTSVKRNAEGMFELSRIPSNVRQYSRNESLERSENVDRIASLDFETPEIDTCNLQGGSKNLHFLHIPTR